MSWEKKKFGDFIKLQRGYDLTKEQFVEGPFPVVSSTSIIGYHNKYKSESPGVVIGRSGTLGQVQFITDNYWPHNTTLYVKDFKGNNPKYVYYFLKSFKTEKSGGGVAVPTLNKNHLNVLDIIVPDVETQNKIASVISKYDDLVENNNKQIKLLEEAAQRLYKEWFVDLHFPGHENIEIIDGVPSGWNKVGLAEISPILTGKKDANYGTDDGEFPFFTCSRDPIRSPSYSFDCDAVILAGNGDFNVKLYRGKFEAYQRTYVFSPTESKFLYLLYYSVRDNMRKLSQGASGSTIKFLKKGMLEDILVSIPTENIIEQFNENCETFQQKIELLKQQIILLQEARDRLSPKLMSGEKEV